jgi:hypothetical protein
VAIIHHATADRGHCKNWHSKQLLGGWALYGADTRSVPHIAQDMDYLRCGDAGYKSDEGRRETGDIVLSIDIKDDSSPMV